MQVFQFIVNNLTDFSDSSPVLIQTIHISMWGKEFWGLILSPKYITQWPSRGLNGFEHAQDIQCYTKLEIKQELFTFAEQF